MVDLNTGIAGIQNSLNEPLKDALLQSKANLQQTGDAETGKTNFTEAFKGIEKYISKVDELQQSSDVSITDLLSGKNDDITSVVSAVSQADLSFKLLVGVRNKLIEAYKQTMNMQL
jgi:flagellar hook-basal body complex protein FliE